MRLLQPMAMGAAADGLDRISAAFHIPSARSEKGKPSVKRVRECIDEQISKLEGQIRDLKKRRNEFADTSHLPPEILANIFVVYASSLVGSLHALEWISVTHVSHHWRAVALDCPHLWSNIIFSNPRWSEIMLERSKKAPISVITFMPSRSDTVLFKALSRTAQLQKLDLSGTSRSLEKALEHLKSAAPVLDTLVLCAPQSYLYPLDPELCQIPDQLFQGSTSALRRLELTALNFGWNSSLFNGLTHLKIDGVPKGNRPSISQFLDLLDKTPDLHILDLKMALPNPQSSPSEGRERITLPKLDTLRLTGSLDECRGVLKHIAVPGMMTIHLICLDVEEDDDVQGIMPAITAAWSAQGSSDSIPPLFQNLQLQDFDSFDKRFTIRGFSQSGPPELGQGGNSASMTLEFSFMDSTIENRRALADVCASLPLSRLRLLSLSSCIDIDQTMWETVFARLPSLECVFLNSQSARSFVDTVMKDPVFNPFSAPAPATQPRPTVQPPPLSTVTYFPRLRSLILHAVEFSLEETEVELDFNALVGCLIRRCDHQAPIQHLKLACCINLSRENVDALKQIVDDVDWDEHEEESDPRIDFGDGDDDYDHDYDSEDYDYGQDSEHIYPIGSDIDSDYMPYDGW